MNEIDEIQEIDDKLFMVFTEFMKQYTRILKEFTFPITLNVLLNFITSTNFIKNSILELADTDNIYSINILFRSLIEHYLKFQYIWVKFGEERNEDTGNDYWKYYSYSEDLDYGKSWQKISSFTNRIPGKDPIELIKSLHPSLNHISNKDLKMKIDQFNYRNVIAYLFKKAETTASKENPFELILKLIPEYSELSSFVHGGPSAQKHILYEENEKRKKEVIRLLQLSIQIAASVKMFTYLMIYQYDNSIGIYYNQTQELMKQLNN